MQRALFWLGLSLIAILSYASVYGQTVTNPTIVTTISTGAMAHNQVVIGQLPTLILAMNMKRRSLIIRNQGAVDMYIGNNIVTTATGLLLKANEVIILDRSYAAWYGITAAVNTTVGYVEE